MSERALTHVRLALKLHEAFNFAQMLQGEMLGQSGATEEQCVFIFACGFSMVFWHLILDAEERASQRGAAAGASTGCT